ncbi:hypothetical protein ACFQ1I_16210 [Kitasatospora arboriphila]
MRALVTPGEQAQYDDSVNTPQDDQHHAATGWLVRFDPGKVALAVDGVRTSGVVRVGEADSGTLEVTTDHTFVYAVRAAEHLGRAGEPGQRPPGAAVRLRPAGPELGPAAAGRRGGAGRADLVRRPDEQLPAAAAGGQHGDRTAGRRPW